MMRISTALPVAVVAAVCSTTSYADEQPAAPGDSGNELSEVVVTAQRRSENIQNIPIQITALSAERLQQGHLATSQDLPALAPALNYTSASGYAQPYLRGVGSDTTGANSDPSVGTYIDGVYVADAQATIMQLLGVERIEVLEGPQGTLYGRNSIAGAINIITTTPTQEPTLSANVGVGQFASRDVGLHMAGGVSNDLAVGLDLAGTYRKPYTKRYPEIGPDDATHEVNWGARLKGVYTPTDFLKLTASAEHLYSKGIDADASRNIQPNALGYVFGAPVVIGNYLLASDGSEYTQVEQTGLMFRADADLQWARIANIVGWRQTYWRGTTDFDGTNAPVIFLDSDPQFTRQISEEFQLLSPDGSRLNWIGGLYYYHQLAGFDPLKISSEVLYPPPLYSNRTFSQVSTDSYAAFGQITIPITAALGLTLGERYTIEKKSWDNPYTDFTDAAGIPIPGTTVMYPAESKRWSASTPKVSLTYKPGSVLWYATFSEGFKSGAFTAANPGTPAVDPESLKSYEVGGKADLFENRLRLNAAAYYYNWKNLQASGFQAGGNNTGFIINAPGADIHGIEASGAAALFPGFTLNASASWIVGNYKRFPNYAAVVIADGGNATAPLDVSGHTVERAPRWTGNLSAEYTHAVGKDSAVVGRVSVYRNSGFFWTPANLQNDFDHQSGYSMLTASLEYKLDADHWSVSAWGTNLTNSHYEISLQRDTFGTGVIDAAPRMFGLNVRYSTK